MAVVGEKQAAGVLSRPRPARDQREEVTRVVGEKDAVL
jgi:hypothetical protein